MLPSDRLDDVDCLIRTLYVHIDIWTALTEYFFWRNVMILGSSRDSAVKFHTFDSVLKDNTHINISFFCDSDLPIRLLKDVY